MKNLIKGKWYYFAKKGKRGHMIGKVEGRGYFMGIEDGLHVFCEGEYQRTFKVKASEKVIYDLGSDQKL